jgi:hypothetical protein
MAGLLLSSPAQAAPTRVIMRVVGAAALTASLCVAGNCPIQGDRVSQAVLAVARAGSVTSMTAMGFLLGSGDVKQYFFRVLNYDWGGGQVLAYYWLGSTAFNLGRIFTDEQNSQTVSHGVACPANFCAWASGRRCGPVLRI